MEFEIKNMGLTIAVGGLAFGGIYLSLLLLELNPLKLIPHGTGSGHKFLFSAVGLAVIFGTGVLLEGVTQSVTAGHGNSHDLPVIETSFAALVDSDRSLRFQIFFDVTNEPAMTQASNAPVPVWGLQYKPVGQDLMLAATNDTLTGRYVSRLKAMFENCRVTNGYYQIIGANNLDTCMDLVNNIYYKAKNVVYQNDNYFTELGAIEMRKNFVLAVLFDFMLLAGIHLLLGVFYTGKKFSQKKPGKFFHRIFQWIFCCNARRTLYVGFLVAYAVMFYCALLAYRVESASYNSRVFGYYATIGTQKNEAHTP